MDYNKFDGPGGVEVRIHTDDILSVCPEGRGGYYPDPRAGTDSIGVHSVIDPFEDNR